MSSPWFEDFCHDPGKAVAGLFSGQAGAGSDLRLDVPELLYQQFPPSLADERARLDDALWSWLVDMREGYACQVERLGFSAYGKRVGDALIALQLLELPQTRDRIRADTGAWLRWLSPLRLAPERDPALECFRLLTRGQPDAHHTALWLRLAEDPRPEYLAVALAGLRLLPNQGNARKNQALMLQALLRHAVKIHHETDMAHAFFDRHFAALRGFFPRGPQHWNRVLDEALEGFLEHTEEPVARKLADALRTSPQAKGGPPSSRKARMPVPARPEEWDTLKNAILGSGHRPGTLARRLFKILERNHAYAEATGVSYFFVRTLHNLGDPLLKRHTLGSADMTQFGVMIERALVWEPANPYCWMLWGEWFRAQGQGEAHEATLREMVRLFPSDSHARESLDRLQARSYPDTAATAFSDASDDEIQERADHDDLPMPLPSALEELLRRGSLAGEFSRALIAAGRGTAASTDRIRQESLKGDPLAGFYSQWLMPKETPEEPPHAWAWKACRYWQESASPDRWRHLAEQFPEAAPETEFLRALAAPDDSDRSGLIGDHCGNHGASRPVDAVMREMQEKLAVAGPSQRSEFAFTVMACAAADPLDVARNPVA